MDSIDKINLLLKERGLDGTPMCLELGLSRAVYSQWNNRTTKPSNKNLKKIADYLGVSVREIMADDDLPAESKAYIEPIVSTDTVSFPVIGGVAAGYDRIGYEDWTGDSLEIPRSYLHGRKPQDYFVLRVNGDSMYPDYQHNDHVLVLRQTTMDRSGQVGIVVYRDECATLKRIEYVMGEDWMILRPINPQYPPITIRDEDLEHCKVLGVAKLVIREVNN